MSVNYLGEQVTTELYQMNQVRRRLARTTSHPPKKCTKLKMTHAHHTQSLSLFLDLFSRQGIGHTSSTGHNLTPAVSSPLKTQCMKAQVSRTLNVVQGDREGVMWCRQAKENTASVHRC